jgi:cytochrome c peroxidase
VKVALLVVALGASLSALGCADGDEQPGYDGPPIPWAYSAFPSERPHADNPTTDQKVALGRFLFYDPILSSDRQVACATCHSEVWGLSDGLPRSVGIGGVGPTGPGRTGPNVTRRNAPSLWNVAVRRALFWDGRADSLEAQALVPLKEPKELGRALPELEADLSAIPEYASLFAAAFPGSTEPVSGENLARAIAAFERSFVSRLAPYDRYVAGDVGALDSETIRGMFLFDEAGCSSCHVPPTFDSPKFAARGVEAAGEPDDGRFEITGDDSDHGAFAVPTLRNVRDSEPYFHSGTVASLRDAVEQEVERSVSVGESRALADDEIDAVERFLDKALTDRTREPHRPKQVPSGLDVPKDGFRIPR